MNPEDVILDGEYHPKPQRSNQLDVTDDAAVMAYTQSVRYQLVEDALTASNGIPQKGQDKLILLSALSDMSDVAIKSRRLSQDAGTADADLVQAIVDQLNQVSPRGLEKPDQRGERKVAIDESAIPTVTIGVDHDHVGVIQEDKDSFERRHGVDRS